MNRPQVKEESDIDWEEITRVVEQYLDDVEESFGSEDDSALYTFKEILVAMYGRKILDWVESVGEGDEDEY